MREKNFVKRPMGIALACAAVMIAVEKRSGAVSPLLFIIPASLLLSRRFRKAGMFALVVLLVIASVLKGQEKREERLVSFGGKSASVSVLLESVTKKEGRSTLEGRVIEGDTDLAGERIRVQVYETLDALPGDVVSGRLFIKRPEGKRNPGGFDYRSYLISKGIFLEASPGYGESVEKTGERSSLYLKVRRYREERIRRVRERLDGERAQIVCALVFGESPGESVTRQFRDAGLSHILAVSGLHAGIVSGILMFLIRPVKRWAGEKGTALLLGAFLIAYLFLTGLTPSAIRAVLMTVSLEAGRSFRFTADSLSALILCALAFLIQSPYLLFQAGFLLTFSACLAIALFYTPLRERIWSPLKGKATDAFLIGLCASSLTLPLSALLFGRSPLVGLVSSLAITPITGPLILFALPVSFLPDWLYFPALSAPCEALASIFLTGASRFSQTPFPAVTGARQALLFALVLIPAVIFASGYARRGKHFIILPALLLFLLLLAPKPLTVTVLDVGQGSSALIEAGSCAVLIDGGGYEGEPALESGRTPISEKVLFPALREKGILSLDAVFISHNHQDHAQGALETLEALPARQVVVNAGWNDDSLSARLHVPLTKARAGLKVGQDAFTITVLGPEGGESLRNDEQNENSLVLLLESADLAVLFPGDIGIESEESIAKRLSQVRAKNRILVAPHHGSGKSNGEALLSAFRPQAVIISCGKNNRYGHPASEALERIEGSGAQVFRTDLEGAVEIRKSLFGLRLRAFDPMVE